MDQSMGVWDISVVRLARSECQGGGIKMRVKMNACTTPCKTATDITISLFAEWLKEK